MLFPALLLLVHGEHSFAPAARPMMPRAGLAGPVAATPAAVPHASGAVAATPAASIHAMPMQQGAAQQSQPASEGRSSAVLMVTRSLLYPLVYSGLSVLAAGVGMALHKVCTQSLLAGGAGRASAAAPSTEGVELAQSLVDPELGAPEMSSMAGVVVPVIDMPPLTTAPPSAPRTVAPAMMADDAGTVWRAAAGFPVASPESPRLTKTESWSSELSARSTERGSTSAFPQMSPFCLVGEIWPTGDSEEPSQETL